MPLAGLLLPLAVLSDPGLTVTPPSSDRGAMARAQQERTERRSLGRYDEVFRRYSKRYFGVAFDWRWFKAQGMADWNLQTAAFGAHIREETARWAKVIKTRNITME